MAEDKSGAQQTAQPPAPAAADKPVERVGPHKIKGSAPEPVEAKQERVGPDKVRVTTTKETP